jgi:hypothetical protein
MKREELGGMGAGEKKTIKIADAKEKRFQKEKKSGRRASSQRRSKT